MEGSLLLLRKMKGILKIEFSFKINYKNYSLIQNYFIELKNNGYVTFISSLTNNEKRSLLKLSSSYQEVNHLFKIIIDKFPDY